MTEKIKINVAVSEKTKKRLAILQSRTDSSSVAEVIRRAVDLLDTVSAHQERGGSLVFRDHDGTETVVKVLF